MQINYTQNKKLQKIAEKQQSFSEISKNLEFVIFLFFLLNNL